MSRKRMKIATGVTLVGLTGLGGYAVLDGRADHAGTPAAAGVTAETTGVRRTDVVERQHVSGALGYAGTHRVLAPARGTLTWLPATGAVVSRGQTAYEVDGGPVVLMYGARAAWRAFGPGMADGADVEQLEANLAALGHGGGLTVDRHFSAATSTAIRRWQRSAGRPVTGSMPLGQVVFLPDAVRIGGHDLQLGAQIEPGTQVEHGTGSQRAITIQLPPRQLPMARVGDAVVVTLPDQQTRNGRVTHIGAVATPTDAEAGPDPPGNSATAPVTVQVDGEVGGFLDQAQVRVSITVAAHRNVLAVPITALNALPGGEYEVIVVDGTTTRRVPVRTGLFDEATGLAEVSGPGLAEGQQVRVPGADA
jgi:peptidoglycan hydrolase-like protein with peptidoglycan-binding domain